MLYALPAGSTERRVIARMPVREPAYMHAFGMSGRHLILAEYPLRVDPLKMALSGPFIENYVGGPSSARSCRCSTARPARTAAPTRRTRSSASTTSTPSSASRRAGRRPRRLRRRVRDRPALPERGRPPRHARPPSCAATRSTSTAAPSRWEALPGGHDVELPRIDYGRRNAATATPTSRAGAGERLDRPARQGGRARRRPQRMERAGLLSRRADLRARAGERNRGRRGDPLGRARRPRALVSARPRRRLVRGAGACRGPTTSRSAFTAST